MSLQFTANSSNENIITVRFLLQPAKMTLYHLLPSYYHQRLTITQLQCYAANYIMTNILYKVDFTKQKLTYIE